MLCYLQLVLDEYERAVETLYLSLRQHNVCILKLPDAMAKVRKTSVCSCIAGGLLGYLHHRA